jgi:hypothetical protein
MQTTEQALVASGFKWVSLNTETPGVGYWSLKLGEVEILAMPLMFGQMTVQVLSGLSCVANIPFKPILKENEL